MANYNVSVTYTANGTQTVFSFPFDYLRKAFVYVELNETNTLENGTDYEVDEKTVVFFEAPAAGTVIRIYRETTTNRLVSWADASVLRAKDLTIQQVQELHILEETKAWVEDNAIIRSGKEWQARNFPIKNVGDPVDQKDATNKEYVDNQVNGLAETVAEFISGSIDFSFSEKYFVASEIGMVPNDNTQEAFNYDIMKNVLAKGGTLVIDNTYYIKNPSTTSALEPEGAVCLTSYNGGEIIASGIASGNATSLFFMSKADIKIENLKITANSALNIVLNNDTTRQLKYGSVTFRNNHFAGNHDLRVLRCQFEGTIDSSNINGWDGCSGLYFYNNRFDNNSQMYVISVKYPVKEFIFKGNFVNEVPKIFGTITWDAQTYAQNPIENVVIANNYIFGSNTLTVQDRLTYRTSFVIEVRKCEVLNNYMEGFGVSGDNTHAYFIYTSAHVLLCCDNVFKNCVSFDATYYNEIFKAKSGAGYKTFLRNHCIIEKSWIDSMNAQLTSPLTGISLRQHSTFGIFVSAEKDISLIFRDNIFDVHGLYQFSATNSNYTMNADEVIFENNIVRMDTTYKFAALVNAGKDVKDVRICKNYVVHRALYDDDVSQLALVAKVDIGGASTQKTNIKVSDNTVELINTVGHTGSVKCNPVYVEFTNQNSVALGDIVVRNNIIRNYKEQTSSTTVYYINANYDHFFVENEKTSQPRIGQVYLQPGLDLQVKYKGDTLPSISQSNSKIWFNKNTGSHWYSLKLSYEDNGVPYSYDIRIKLTSNANGTYVTYRTQDGYVTEEYQYDTVGHKVSNLYDVNNNLCTIFELNIYTGLDNTFMIFKTTPSVNNLVYEYKCLD